MLNLFAIRTGVRPEIRLTNIDCSVKGRTDFLSNFRQFLNIYFRVKHRKYLLPSRPIALSSFITPLPNPLPKGRGDFSSEAL